METKFTKGNWEVIPTDAKKENGNPLYYNIAIDGDVFILTHSNKYLNIDDEQVKANALLISKAPEMFEMLRIISEREVFEGKIKFDIHLKNLVKQLLKEATEL